MGFESYNQLIKSLATMSNFKNVLTSVARFWIAKSGRSLIRGCTAAFSAGEVCVVSETTDMARATAESPLFRRVSQAYYNVASVLAVRQVCSFTRDGDSVEVGTWLLASNVVSRMVEAAPVLVQVLELQELVFAEDTQLFMLGACRPVPPRRTERGGAMIASLQEWDQSAGTDAVFRMASVTFALVHVSKKVEGEEGEVIVQEL